MSIEALSWAFAQEIFSSSQKFVLVALANHAGDKGMAYPSVGTICDLTRLNHKTVRKALDDLVSTGVISDTGKKWGQTQQVAVYRFPEEAWRYPKTGTFNRQRLQEDSRKTPGRYPKTGSEPVTFNLESQNTHTTVAESVSGPWGKKATIEELKIFCNSHGMSDSDAEWFFNKCEGNGWTNGGKPIRNCGRTLLSWKNAGYLPSQKNGNGNYGRKTDIRSYTENPRNFGVHRGVTDYGEAAKRREARDLAAKMAQAPDAPQATPGAG